MSVFTGNLRGTTIGSLPLRDADEATALIFKYASLLPSWVQLPKNPGEGMLEQYNEGLPGIKEIDGKIYFDTADPSFEQQILEFYENYLAAVESDTSAYLERFAISETRARGFHSFIEFLSSHKERTFQLVKGQITGPFTLATGLKDQHGRFAFYNQQLRDVIVKLLCLKAMWQIKRLQEHAVSVLMFIDEPSLSGFGSSAFMGVQAEDIKKDLNEVADIIHRMNGYAGVHCCENTDWSILLTSDIDVLNFDAYGFFDRVFLYKNDLKKFIQRGGMLAWGIVPTHAEEVISQVSVDSLVHLWKSEVRKLVNEGIPIETIAHQSLITPSCGAGSLSPEAALRILQLLHDTSETLRKEFSLS
jgi:methionine synthase II (cobalamin-independent)